LGREVKAVADPENPWLEIMKKTLEIITENLKEYLPDEKD